MPTTFWNKARNLFFRAPEPARSNYDAMRIGDGKGGVLPPRQVDIRPIENTVIDTVASLFSLVSIDSDLEILEQPDKTLTLRAWLKMLGWHAAIDGIFAIVVDRYAGKDRQYLIFPDSEKPTKSTTGTYTYSRNDQSYTVRESEILQFRSKYQSWDNVGLLRRAEDAFWTRYLRMGGFSGVVSMPQGEMSFNSEEVKNEDIREMLQDLSKRSAVYLPDGLQFTEMKSFDDVERAFETISRAWCYNYKLPTSLINLDLPAHTTTSLSATYGHFLRQHVKPLIEDVMSAIKWRTGASISVNYRKIEEGSVQENAEALMKLSQTGILTINEIRDLEGYPPIEGGDKFPDVAGAPPTGDNGRPEGGGGQ